MTAWREGVTRVRCTSLRALSGPGHTVTITPGCVGVVSWVDADHIMVIWGGGLVTTRHPITPTGYLTQGSGLVVETQE